MVTRMSDGSDLSRSDKDVLLYYSECTSFLDAVDVK